MAALFTHKNARGASVAEVESQLFFEKVQSVDIDRGVVTLICQPLRVVNDEIETYDVRFRTIHPIYAGRSMPVLFHCYGRY